MEGSVENWKNITGHNSEVLIQNLKDEVTRCYENGSLRDWENVKMPGWIVSEHQEYGVELEKIANNWGKLCSRLQVPAKGIIRTRNIAITMEDNKNYTVLYYICECLTKMGYAVKYYKDYAPCKTCNKIILGKHLQETLWGVGNYNLRCGECQKQ